MTPRHKAIKEAISGSTRKTMHLGKKGAPGINHKELTPKEKYYRKSNESRTSNRLNTFNNSSYGKHLTERAKRRGEEN